MVKGFKDNKQQEKLPLGDFFVTIARKIVMRKLSLEKEKSHESLSACKYRVL